jgi:hypothetical protein
MKNVKPFYSWLIFSLLPLLAPAQCGTDSLANNAGWLLLQMAPNPYCLPSGCSCDSMEVLALPSGPGLAVFVADPPGTLRVLLVRDCRDVLLDTCQHWDGVSPWVVTSFLVAPSGGPYHALVCGRPSVFSQAFYKPGTGHGLPPKTPIYQLDTCPVVLDAPLPQPPPDPIPGDVGTWWDVHTMRPHTLPLPAGVWFDRRGRVAVVREN